MNSELGSLHASPGTSFHRSPGGSIHSSASSSLSSGDVGRILSSNVRRLHGALTRLLSDQEREQLLHCLRLYHSRRNVCDLVRTLRLILRPQDQRQLFPMLRLVIPRSDQLLFDQYTSEGLYLKDLPPGSAGYSAALPGGVSGFSTTIPSTAPTPISVTAPAFSTTLPGTVPAFSTPGLGTSPAHAAHRVSPGFNNPLPGASNDDVRQVILRRSQSQEGLGFSIRGGVEHGVGIYVSLVEPGSLAEEEGLRVGDQILKANGRSLDRVSHAEAVKALRGSQKLVLSVLSSGRLPGGRVSSHIFTWVDAQGRSVSPPAGPTHTHSPSLRGPEQEKRSHLQLLQNGDEKKVNLVLGEGGSLGLLIRGGAEYSLGVYITGVDRGSEAESAGLKVGDQILEVNGISFLSVPHDDAVNVLRSSRHLMMTVRDVGRVPHARTIVGETQWLSSSHTGAGDGLTTGAPWDLSTETPIKPVFYRGPAGSQVTLSSIGNQTLALLEEQTRLMLTEPERRTMSYYLQQYRERHISVRALLMAMFELFNTQAKFSLLSELRPQISPQDVTLFDNLVLKREIESMKSRQCPGDAISVLSQSLSTSSSESHQTSSTISTARERLLWLLDVMENGADTEGSAESGSLTHNTLPDISLDDVTSLLDEPPTFRPTPPPSFDDASAQRRQQSGERTQRPSSESSQSGLFFTAPPNSSPPLPPLATPPTSPQNQDSNKVIYATICPRIHPSVAPAQLALVAQLPLTPFPRVQSPTRLKVTAESPPNPPSPSHGDTSDPQAIQHFVMVEVHRPNSEPDVNEIRAVPQARAVLPLSQHPDCGQTLSEDSGVDTGDIGGGSKDSSPQPQKPRGTEEPGMRPAQPPGLLGPTVARVRLMKSAPTLGIAIEGGANTRQPMPRIVTIQRGGSAHNCSKLRVGQVILEVNGVSLQGKEHREAARIIAEAFKTKEKDHVDFLVTDFNVSL